MAKLGSMVSADGLPAWWDSGDGPAVLAEALEAALEALQWRLPEARWQVVAQALDTMAAALTDSGPEDLAEATADLELAGPLRITRLGAMPVVPPPPPIRDRLNRLVYSLGYLAADTAPSSKGADDDDASAN